MKRMKNFKKSITILSLLMLIFIANSCAKDDNIENTYNSNLVQRTLGKETIKNDYMIIDHIGKDNEIAIDLLENIKYNIDELNIDEIGRVDYGWNDYTVFEIPFKNIENKRLTIFKINNQYLTAITEITNVGDKRNHVVVSTVNKLALYEFDMVNEQTFENFNLINLGSFVANSSADEPKYDKMQDCGVYKMAQCIECGLDVCSQDWRCEIAAIATGPAFAAGLVITCGLRQAVNSLQ